MPTFNLSDLQKSATQYQRELLILPIKGAEKTLQHMQPYAGLTGDIVLSSLEGDAELAPYSSSRKDKGNFNIKPRTLELQLGNCAYDFDPNELFGSIFGNGDFNAQGEAMKDADINADVLRLVAARLGRKLNGAIFGGVRKDGGTTTKDLFDGFDKITDKEIAATTIKADLGNYVAVKAINASNAIDEMQRIYDAMDDDLKDQPTKIFCSHDVYTAYCRNYQLLHGALPYNTEYKKTYLEGSDGLAEFVPLSSKKGSSYIHIAPQSNMCYGFGAGVNPAERMAVEKYQPWMLTLEAVLSFGVQFRSIAKEHLLVAKVGALS